MFIKKIVIFLLIISMTAQMIPLSALAETIKTTESIDLESTTTPTSIPLATGVTTQVYKPTDVVTNTSIEQVPAMATSTEVYTAKDLSDLETIPEPFAEILALPEEVYGDVNGDGKVNSADYTLLRRYLLGNISSLPAANWEKVGDVNIDGKVDSADYTILRKYLLKIILSLPYRKAIVTPTIAPTITLTITPTKKPTETPTITPTPTITLTSTPTIKLTPTVTPIGVISAPTNLCLVSKTDTSITFNWTRVTDNVTISGYDIYNYDVKVGSTQEKSFTYTGTTSNSIYRFSVKALDAAGNASEESLPLIVDVQNPSAPENLKVSSKTGWSVSLAWDVSTDNYGISGYDIFKDGDKIGTSYTTNYICDEQMPNTQYAFSVEARDLGGNVSDKSHIIVSTNADDYGDNTSCTQNLIKDVEVAGCINYFGDVDYYSFTPSENGEYSFQSIGSATFLNAYLYDSEDVTKYVGNANYSEDSNYNFTLNQVLTAGKTYYLKVERAIEGKADYKIVTKLGVPDLIVKSIAPLNAFTGQPVLFSAVVMNQGNAAVPENSGFRVGFSVNGGNTNFWTTSCNDLIKPNSSVTLTVSDGSDGSTLTLSNSGTYTITATVDDKSALSESIENNNTMTESISIYKNDLFITSITPDLVYAGQPVSFSAKVKNQSSNSTFEGKTFKVGFKIDDSDAILWSSDYTSVIKSDSTVTVSASDSNFTFADAGVHKITAIIDDGAITEDNEINNSYTQSLTVGKSDLIVTDITDTVYVGEHVTLTANVKNVGNIATQSGKSFRVGFKINDSDTILWSDQYTKSIAINGSTSISVTKGISGSTYTFLESGAYKVEAFVDDQNEIAEINEDNNKFIQYTYAGKSDLIITSIAPDSFHTGMPVTFSAVVKNQGDVPTTAGKGFKVGFKINGSDTMLWSAEYTKSISAGGTATISILSGASDPQYSYTNVGVFNVIATVYDTGNLNEADQTNNDYSQEISVEKSDLVVTGLSPTYSTLSNTVTFSAVVKNQGSVATPTGKTFRVGFKINGGDTIIWSGYASALGSGSTKTLTASAGLSGSTYTLTAEGEYLVTAIVDDENVVDELVETNNDLTQSINSQNVVENTSDLIVTDITPNVINENEAVKFTATVKNIGSVATPTGKSFRVGFKIDGNDTILWSNDYTSTIAAGISKSIVVANGMSEATYTFPKSGTYKITAIVDDAGNVIEGDEENNSFTKLATVDKCDLVITGITSSAPYVGQPVTFKVNVKNQGIAPTQSGKVFRVAVNINGTDLYSANYSYVIQPGGSATLSISGNYTFKEIANYSIIAIVDDLLNVVESDDENNDFTKNIAISKCDLVVTEISTDTSYAGEPLTFKATVKNIGNIASLSGKAFRVGFKVSGSDTILWSSNYSVAIAAGGTATISVAAGTIGKTYTFEDSGIYPVTAFVDDGYAIDESNEDNNSYTKYINIDKGDLVITGITPNLIYAGQVTTLRIKVENKGRLATTSGKSIRVGLRINDSETVIWTNSITTSISAGSYKNLTAESTFPTEGIYKITAIVDEDGNVNESDEENNTFTQYVTAGKCDLVITSITPNKAHTGEPVSFSVKVKNTGKLATIAGKSFRVGFKVNASDTVLWTSGYTSVISSGSEVTLNAATEATYTFANNGIYAVTAEIDDMDSVDESNTINNQFTQNMDVGRCDLVITKITPEFAYVGQAVAFTATVKNIGSVATPDGKAIRIGFKVAGSDTVLWSDNYVKSIAAGSSVDITVLSGTKYTFDNIGFYFVEASLDESLKLGETDESNNSYTQEFYVGKCDLVITEIGPPYLRAGGDTTLSVKVKNIGSLPTYGKAFRVGFKTNETDTVYWSKLYTASIAPGKEVTISAADGLNGSKHTLPMLGTCIVVAIVDDLGGIDESNEDNNAFTRTINIGCDLTIEKIMPSVDSVLGHPIDYTVTVRNNSNVDIPLGKTIRVSLKVAGSDTIQWVGEYQYSIDAGSCVDIELTDAVDGSHYVFTEAGKQKVIAVVDDLGVIDESNELNNTLEKEISIGCDLKISEITPVVMGVDQPVTFIAKVFNAADVDSLSSIQFRVGFKINDSDTIYWGYGNTPHGRGITNVPVTMGTNGTTFTAQELGTFKLTAIVDDTVDVMEINESNNVFLRDVIVGYPDLAITGINPIAAYKGKTTDFIINVKNLGVAPTTSGIRFRVRLKLNNGEIIWSDYYSGGIKSGEIVSLNISVDGKNFLEVGQQQAEAIVDYENEILESNDDNNSMTSEINVVERPDLVITDISYNPEEPLEGEEVEIKVTVKNIGSYPTLPITSTTVNLTVNNIEVALGKYAKTLEAGESITLLSTRRSKLSAGNYTLNAIVDNSAIIAETNEVNNTYTENMVIGKTPDLIVTNVSMTPTNPIVGEKVLFQATIKNDGAGASPAGRIHRVVFKIDGKDAVIWSDSYMWSIEPGESIIVAATYGTGGKEWIAVEGTHDLTAVVNDTSSILESDGSNNTYNKSFTVTSARVFNPEADYDSDGISNESEMNLGTSLILADTDEDRISDFDEINGTFGVKTDPANYDSDGDMISDGSEFKLSLDPLTQNERVVTPIKTATQGNSAYVEVYGDQNLLVAPFKAVESENIVLNSLKGITGKPVEISIGDTYFDYAIVTFKYDKNMLGDTPEDEQTIFWVDPDNKKLVPLPESNVTIDKENQTISGRVYHFSTYIPGDKNMNTDLSVDVVFCVDQSGSMGYHDGYEGSDPNFNRISAIERFINGIDMSSINVGLVGFASIASEISPLKGDVRALNSALPSMRIILGGTNIYNALKVSYNTIKVGSGQKKIIVLLTDGEDIEGYTDEEFENQGKGFHKEGISVNVVGLGGDVKISTIETIASAAGGFSFYLDSAEDIELLYTKLMRMLNMQPTDDKRPSQDEPDGREPDSTGGTYWDGTWDVYTEDEISYAMELSQSGSVVTGKFGTSGRIEGQVFGKKLKGNWIDGSSCGTFEYELTFDGDNYLGKWNTQSQSKDTNNNTYASIDNESIMKMYYAAAASTPNTTITSKNQTGSRNTGEKISDWKGTWNVNDQDNIYSMNLVQETGSDRVSGSYEWKHGLILGKATGNNLKGGWRQVAESEIVTGTYAFTMTEDGDSYVGSWINSGDGSKDCWIGSKEGTDTGTYNWAGDWYVYEDGRNYMMKLQVNETNGTVSGTYDYDGGKLEGTIYGNRLVGTWTQNNNSGNFGFIMADDGQSYIGFCTSKGGYAGTWDGSRKQGTGKTNVTLQNLDDFGFYMGSTPSERQSNLSELNRVLKECNINTPLRIAFFLGQAAHESSFGSRTLEKFNGSSPETYFNNKYSNNSDLGNKGGNDGELFRGSGYIQITGRDNYQRFASFIKDQSIMKDGYRLIGGVYNKPVSQITLGELGVIDVGKYAWEAAGWFWEYGSATGKNLNDLADNKDYRGVLNGINSNDTGSLQKRNSNTNKIYKILTGSELGLPK